MLFKKKLKGTPLVLIPFTQAEIKDIGQPFGAIHKVHVDTNFQWSPGTGTGPIATSFFTLHEKMGEGSFGAVFRATHNESGYELAIKIIEEIEKGSQEIIKEIEVLKKCNHPNIVSYFGSCLQENQLWILMDFCSLGSVRDLLEIVGETFLEKQIGYICQETLKGLGYLHGMGIIHRDVKGANILITGKGEIKLGDFGVSQPLMTSLKTPADIVGTPLYISPEGIKDKIYGPATDIWALGITIIELADGFPPYSDMNPIRAMFMVPSKPPPTVKDPKNWSKEFLHFLELCLKKNVKERPDVKTLLKHPFLLKSKGNEVLKTSIEKAYKEKKKSSEETKEHSKKIPTVQKQQAAENTAPIKKGDVGSVPGESYSTMLIKEETGFSRVICQNDGTVVQQIPCDVGCKLHRYLSSDQVSVTQSVDIGVQTEKWEESNNFRNVGLILLVIVLCIYLYEMWRSHVTPVVPEPKCRLF